ncbi:MAG: BRO-N domain-containing protein [Verrucomicrobiales bacterium]
MNQPNTHTAVNPILETAFDNHEVRIFGTVENPVVARSDLEPILKIQNIRQVELDPRDLVYLKDTSGGQVREIACVTEIGLYELIFRSRTEAAKRFRRWVCEVIREIRLKGYYAAPVRSKEELKLRRLRMELQAAELRAEASRIERAARKMLLPERPEGWVTIGEFISPDMAEHDRLSLVAKLGNALRNADTPCVMVRDARRDLRKAWPPEAIHTALAKLARIDSSRPKLAEFQR